MAPINLRSFFAFCLIFIHAQTELSAGHSACRYGIAVGDSALLCVVFSGAELKAGDRIALIDHSEASQRIIFAKIKSKLSSFSQEIKRSNIRGTPYSAEFTQSPPQGRILAVAVSKPPHLQVRKGLVVGSPKDGSSPLHFRFCTSNEGTHLTVWSGEPLKGRRVYHEYFYLGYDVDPSCTEADYQ